MPSAEQIARRVLREAGKGNKGWKPTAEDPPRSAGLPVWRKWGKAAGVGEAELLKMLEPDPGTPGRNYRLRADDGEGIAADAAQEVEDLQHQGAEDEIEHGPPSRRPPEADEIEGSEEEVAEHEAFLEASRARAQKRTQLSGARARVAAATDDAFLGGPDGRPEYARVGRTQAQILRAASDAVVGPGRLLPRPSSDFVGGATDGERYFSDSALLDFILRAHGLTREQILGAMLKAEAAMNAAARAALDELA